MKRALVACVLFLLFSFSGEQRPSQWAQPLSLKGIENLYQVNAYIYRSQQPSKEGMQNIKAQGVRKVINLRNFHSDKNELRGINMGLYEANINTWKIKDEDVISVLRILKDSCNGPYLVHCQHGADRTGLICAMYRMVFQHWSKEEALDELLHGGYGYHEVWKNIPEYINKVEVQQIRAEVLK